MIKKIKYFLLISVALGFLQLESSAMEEPNNNKIPIRQNQIDATTSPEEIMVVSTRSNSGNQEVAEHSNLKNRFLKLFRKKSIPPTSNTFTQSSISSFRDSDDYLNSLHTRLLVLSNPQYSFRERIANFVEFVEDRMYQIRLSVRHSELINTLREKILDLVEEHTPLGSGRRLRAAWQEIEENPGNRLALSNFRSEVCDFSLSVLEFITNLWRLALGLRDMSTR